VVVAAKHQSMLDVFMLFEALPEARFVMKRELTRAPVFGFFALRVGAVPVDRGGGSAAMRAMVETLAARPTGQLVIYPQGTRTPPGETRPYKIGVHALYQAAGAPCIPAATNSGLFQPRGLAIRPGVAVVEFLDPIPPGLAREPFMARLEAIVEEGAARLAEAAGHRSQPRPQGSVV
jgi:1-acyl-sn-glycerol-3-phosphate acyltransferase